MRGRLAQVYRVASTHPYVLLIIATLLPRVLWLLYTRPVPVSDFEQYRDLAAGLLDYGQYGYPTPTAFRFPGYPVFLVPLMLVSRSDFWLSLGTVALSALTVALLYAFTVRATHGDGNAALMAGLAYALYPPFIYLAPVLASENLMAVFIVGAALVVIRGDMNRWTSPAATGVLAAAAVLTRGEAVLYVPVFAAAAALRSSASWKGGFVAAGLVAVVATACVAPWVVRNTIVVGTGAGLSTNARFTLYVAHPGEGVHSTGTQSEIVAERDIVTPGVRETLAAIGARPLQLVQHAASSTVGLYRLPRRATAWSIRLPRVGPGEPWPTRDLPGIRWFDGLAIIAYVALVLLAALSLARWSALSTELRVITVGLIAANWFCYGVVFIGWPRYRYIQEVCFCVLAGIAISHLAPMVGRRFAGATASAVR